jgi:hypothetical protein
MVFLARALTLRAPRFPVIYHYCVMTAATAAGVARHAHLPSHHGRVPSTQEEVGGQHPVPCAGKRLAWHPLDTTPHRLV